MIIGVDCDDVVISLVPTWLEFYNKDYDDNLTQDKITDWDVSLFVKPECGKKIFNYVHDLDKLNIYDHCPEVDRALWGINTLRKFGHRVVFISAGNFFNSKENWLMEHGFLDKREDFIQAFDKSLVAVDYLIDDGFHNISNLSKGAKGILFNRPWNAKHEFNGYRFDDWAEIVFHFLIESVSKGSMCP